MIDFFRPLCLLLTVLTAILEWIAVGQRRRTVEYFSKPGVMLFLIAWMIFSGGLDQHNLVWFILGAFFSLAGDVFLLIPRERLGFTLGLASFLIAHTSYIIAMNLPPTPLGWHSLGLAAAVIALVLWISRRVLGSLQKKGLQRMILPVGMYILILGTMLFCALSLNFRADWQAVPALFAALGALSFTVSDSLLAWNKFVAPVRHGRVLLMITYHLGQGGILIGAILQYA